MIIECFKHKKFGFHLSKDAKALKAPPEMEFTRDCDYIPVTIIIFEDIDEIAPKYIFHYAELEGWDLDYERCIRPALAMLSSAYRCGWMM